MTKFVAVAGSIGTGKTSLTTWLVKTYGLEPFYEPNDENPYLADFYRDMPRWAFHSQVCFLTHKLALHQTLEASNRPAVIDRTIYEDAEIFARNLHRTGAMAKRDWDTYRRLYEGIRAGLRPPDVLLALTCTVAAAKKRIARRGREMERAIPDGYLRGLTKLYAEWFDGYALSPIVRIDTTKLDYVESLTDLIELRGMLDGLLGPR